MGTCLSYSRALRQRNCSARSVCSLILLGIAVTNLLSRRPQFLKDDTDVLNIRSTSTPTTTIHTTPGDTNQLYERLNRIVQKCGQLCHNAVSEQTWRNASVPISGSNLRLTMARDIHCQDLMADDEIDAADTTVPFPIPDALLPFYSVNQSVAIYNTTRYVNVYLGGAALENIWTQERVDAMIKSLKGNQDVRGTYGPEGTAYVKNKLAELDLKGKHVLVIGSEQPWIEAIVLSLGAAHVTTLEYGSIQSQHRQITTMTPDQMRQQYAKQILPLFDAVVTHSSVEHSGLGRYGDALNPWGDLLTIARAWCVTKPDAVMYVGVPIGSDAIEFNGHRIYGPLRFSLLATNWVQLDGDRHNDADFNGPPILTHGGVGVLFKKVENFDAYT
jgi:hypothetical protein